MRLNVLFRQTATHINEALLKIRLNPLDKQCIGNTSWPCSQLPPIPQVSFENRLLLKLSSLLIADQLSEATTISTTLIPKLVQPAAHLANFFFMDSLNFTL